MAERDPYEVLGVERDASETEIRAMWRRLVSIYHPDQHAQKQPDVRAEAERRMARVNGAYAAIQRGDVPPNPNADASSAAPVADPWPAPSPPPPPPHASRRKARYAALLVLVVVAAGVLVPMAWYVAKGFAVEVRFSRGLPPNVGVDPVTVECNSALSEVRGTSAADDLRTSDLREFLALGNAPIVPGRIEETIRSECEDEANNRMTRAAAIVGLGLLGGIVAAFLIFRSTARRS